MRRLTIPVSFRMEFTKYFFPSGEQRETGAFVIGGIVDGEAHFVVLLVPDVLHPVAVFLGAGNVAQFPGKRKGGHDVGGNGVVDDLHLLAADIGTEMCAQQHVQFFGGEFARAQLLPLRLQPVQAGEIVRELGHDRLQQHVLGAFPGGIGRVPVGAEILLPAHACQQRTYRQQGFLLEIVVTDGNGGIQVMQLDQFDDLPLLVGGGLGIGCRRAGEGQDGQQREESCCRVIGLLLRGGNTGLAGPANCSGLYPSALWNRCMTAAFRVVLQRHDLERICGR